MKLTKYKISLISLAMVFLIALSAFFGLQFMPAEASGTTSGENVFRKSGENASLVAAERVVKSGSGNDGTTKNYYMTFRFVNGEEDEDNESYVYYNNKLAYNWYEKDKVPDSETGGETDEEGVWQHHFNMELGFDNTDFDRYVITFESQQYLKTKDGKTANYVMFFPAGVNQVYVHVTQDKDDTVDSIDEAKKTPFDRDHIRIEFIDGGASGNFKVQIKNENKSSVNNSVTENKGFIYDFKNIGGNYAKNVTSGTTVYPLIFEADFKEDAAETAFTSMVMYSLNGQELAATNGTLDVGISTGSVQYFTLNSINDNKSPVLCLENDFKFFTQGGKVDFDYVVIDVLRTSASGKINYYVLSNEQKKAGENGGEFDYNDTENKNLFKEVGDNDVFETDRDAYLPMDELSATAFEPVYIKDGDGVKKNVNGRLCADMLVKMYVHIYDTSSSSVQETADIFLDWYLSGSDYIVPVNGEYFVAVAQDKLGATYNYESEAHWQTILGEYQEEVNKAADGLSAGSSNYFYLPSPEKLFSDNGTAYADMKLSIYYCYGSDEQNNSNLATSNLSINVTKQGAYTFTVYAIDAAGNNMYYLEEVTEPDLDYPNFDVERDGKYYKYVEFSSSEIWTMFKDKEKKNKLPWFTFNVKYTGVEFEEDPGLQATGYVGTSYESASFKINGVDYTTTYRLFYFNRDVYSKDNNGKSFTYEEFIEIKDSLFNSAETRKYFTEIIALDSMEETDEEYKEFADYGWSNSSTSFTPQASGYYYMIAEAKDKDYEADPVTKSLAVVVSEASKSLKGESDWLKNNLTSVILLSVAALALIGIVLLLVIKPKDKEDIDVRFEEKKKNRKNK